MNKIPKLVTDLVAFVVIGKEQLYLAILNDKKEISKVKKRIGSSVYETKISSNNFNLRLDINSYGEVEAFISNNEKLPKKTEEYKVMNFDESTASKLLLEGKNDHGLFVESVEVCFSGEHNELVSFVSKDMPSYQLTVDEMIRSFFLESGKKTKKWIPGNRYDNADTTFYYLGTFLSRKESPSTSDFHNTSDQLTPVGLYVNQLKGEKSIDEVLKTRYFSVKDDDDGIKVIWGNKPSCTDSGKYLENDTPITLSSWYLDIINNIPEKATHSSEIFALLNYLSEDDSLEYSTELSILVRDIVRDCLKKTIYDNWNLYKAIADEEIGDKYKSSDNEKKLIKLFIDSIKDSNTYKDTYYTNFFISLNIDLEKLSSEVIQNWNEAELSYTFEDYLKNIEYFSLRYSTVDLSTSFQGSNDTIITIEDLFGNDTELAKSLLQIVNSARLDYGINITSYEEVKISRTSTMIVAKVTIKDLINFFGGENNLSEKIKNEIMDKKFSKLVVYCYKDSELK